MCVLYSAVGPIQPIGSLKALCIGPTSQTCSSIGLLLSGMRRRGENETVPASKR